MHWGIMLRFLNNNLVYFPQPPSWVGMVVVPIHGCENAGLEKLRMFPSGARSLLSEPECLT